MKKIACFDCSGTGGDDGCYLCNGDRIITVRRALKNGFAKADLEEVYQGRCDCPNCHADSCELCDGCGTVTADVHDREMTRVLVFGLKQVIPPVLERVTFRNGYSRVHDHERLLSPGAAWECKKRGWSWRVTVLAFGDKLNLTPAGKVEAQKRYPQWLADLSEISLDHWLKWMDATEDAVRRNWWSEPEQIPPELLARWADDGGAAHREAHQLR